MGTHGTWTATAVMLATVVAQHTLLHRMAISWVLCDKL